MKHASLHSRPSSAVFLNERVNPKQDPKIKMGMGIQNQVKLNPKRMKSTKVQNPWRILLHALRALSLVDYANARARKLATPRVLSVLAPARAFWARLNVVDNRWVSWVFPCGSASITVNTNTHAHHFCYEEKWPPKCMEHYGSPARSQQRSIFRENPTNFLTFGAR